MRSILFLLASVFVFITDSFAQDIKESRKIVPIFDEEFSSDTINLNAIYIYGSMNNMTEDEVIRYTRLLRDVKKTYPYAKIIAQSVIETYEIMQTLETDKQRDDHIKAVKKYMMKRYKPELSKLTKRQGRILIKLVDRECGSSSYDIVKAIIGDFQAGFYNVFAGLFGNSLKTRYEPEGKDADIEKIVLLIEKGEI